MKELCKISVLLTAATIFMTAASFAVDEVRIEVTS